MAWAGLKLRRAPVEEIEEKTRAVAEKRRGALPSEPNAGSVFKNPPGDYAGRLIEACGLKGMRRGGAAISARHANVIVNEGGATAADVLTLMRLARDSGAGALRHHPCSGGRAIGVEMGVKTRMKVDLGPGPSPRVGSR